MIPTISQQSKKFIVGFCLFFCAAVVLMGCNNAGNEEVAAVVAEPTGTATQPPTPTLTPSPTATSTQLPTATPTITPSPSATPLPTATPTRALQSLSSSESRLIDIPYTGLYAVQSGEPTVNDVAVSPDDKYLAVASDQGLLIYDLQTLDLLYAVSEDGSSKGDVIWSPDGTKLAVSSGPRVWIWDFVNQKTLFELSGHPSAVTSIAWSPLVPLLLAVGNNGAIASWDMETGEVIAPVSERNYLDSVSFSPDGVNMVTTQDNFLFLYNIFTQEDLAFDEVHTDRIYEIDWSYNSAALVSASGDDTLCVWDVETGECFQVLECQTDGAVSVAWSPDGRFIASGGSFTTLIWDVATWQPIYRLRGHADTIRAVDWFSDGRHLVTGSADGTVRIWELPQP